MDVLMQNSAASVFIMAVIQVVKPVVADRHMKFLPLLAASLGVVYATLIAPLPVSFAERVVVGALAGLAAVGMHQSGSQLLSGLPAAPEAPKS